MENKVLKLGRGRSTQDVYAEIRQGNSERWTKVTIVFRLLHEMTVLLGFVYLHKMNLVIK